MRCQVCGAEIGDKKVCPLCGSPMKNVLVGGYGGADGNAGPPYEDDPQTMVVPSSHEAQVSEYGTASPRGKDTKPEGSAGPSAEKKSKMYTQSVIPDATVPEKKPKMSKKKKIILFSILGVVLVLVICGVTAFLLYKSCKSYLEELKAVKVSFVEPDSNPRKDMEAFYQNAAGDAEYTIFKVSSGGTYAAFETEDKKTMTVVDSITGENTEEVVYSFEFYLITKSKEVLFVQRYEKKVKKEEDGKDVGRIDLIGVSDRGIIVFNDTERGKSFLLADGASESELGDPVKSALLYANGDVLYLTDAEEAKKTQLCYKGGDADRLIASGVEAFSFMDGGEFYGSIRPVEEVTSTTSISRVVIYQSGSVLFRKDMDDSRIGGDIWEGNLGSWTDTTIYDKEMNIVAVPEKDVSGDGRYEYEDGDLIFRWKWFHRNLGHVDDVVCLAGDKIYCMKGGQLYSVDVFSKEEEKIADHKMQLILK